MDITKFAQRVKQCGFVEEHDAHLLKELAEAWIEWQELHEEIRDRGTPVSGPADEKKMAELSAKFASLAEELNA